MIKTHNGVSSSDERREQREHGESIYVWSGVNRNNHIIDTIQTPSRMRDIRCCDNVVANDEVDNVEFLVRETTKEFLSRNDMNRVNEEFVMEVKKKSLK